MNNSAIILKSVTSEYYGSVTYRLTYVIDNGDWDTLLESQGFLRRDHIYGHIPRNIKDSIQNKDLIAFKMFYTKEILQFVGSRLVIPCKNDHNLLIYSIIDVDNKYWSSVGTLYEKNYGGMRKPPKNLPLGCSIKDFDRFYKKCGRYLPEYSFGTENEALCHINKLELNTIKE